MTLEDRMWQLMKDASNNEIGRTVRISQLADQYLPIPHKKWATDIVKSWDNQGYVVAMSNGARAQLTEKGAQHDTIRS